MFPVPLKVSRMLTHLPSPTAAPDFSPVDQRVSPPGEPRFAGETRLESAPRRRDPRWDDARSSDPHPQTTNSRPQRGRYPSDLTDAQWDLLSPVVQRRRDDVGRPTRHDLRNVLDALNYRWQTGCSWRMLPHDFPPWATVYSYFRRWQRRGLLKSIRDGVLRPLRSLPGPQPEPVTDPGVAQTRMDNEPAV